jgi:hypothetical protein
MRGDKRVRRDPALRSPIGRRPPRHEFRNRQQPPCHLKVAPVASDVECDHDVVGQSTPSPGPVFLIGDGIAHNDHHCPRTAAYRILARSHHARTVSPGRKPLGNPGIANAGGASLSRPATGAAVGRLGQAAA